MATVTIEQKQRMKELRGDGWTYKQIADEFDVSAKTVVYHVSDKQRERMQALSRLRDARIAADPVLTALRNEKSKERARKYAASLKSDRKAHSVTNKMVKEMRECRAQGMTLKKIGLKFSCSMMTAARHTKGVVTTRGNHGQTNARLRDVLRQGVLSEEDDTRRVHSR